MEAQVESFEELLHAEIFAGFLREQDIQARVENTHSLAVNALWGQALGHFKVFVPNAQLLAARGLLTRWRAGEFALDDSAGDAEVATPENRDE